MKKSYLIVAVISIFGLISGCSTMRRAISEGAKINDEALNVAEFTICKGATVGSVRRHYSTPKQAEIWKALCNSVDDFSPEGVIVGNP